MLAGHLASAEPENLDKAMTGRSGRPSRSPMAAGRELVAGCAWKRLQLSNCQVRLLAFACGDVSGVRVRIARLLISWIVIGRSFLQNAPLWVQSCNGQRLAAWIWSKSFAHKPSSFSAESRLDSR